MSAELVVFGILAVTAVLGALAVVGQDFRATIAQNAQNAQYKNAVELARQKAELAPERQQVPMFGVSVANGVDMSK